MKGTGYMEWILQLIEDYGKNSLDSCLRRNDDQVERGDDVGTGVPACTGNATCETHVTTDLSRQAGTHVTTSRKADTKAWVPDQSGDHNVLVTYGRNIAKPSDIITVSMLWVEAEIKSGRHQAAIQRLRDCYDCYMEAWQDGGNSPKFIAELKRNYQTAKLKLPWFSLAVFTGRRSSDKVRAIYGVILDFDDVRDTEHFKERVRDNIREAHMAFVSPSGKGVKVLFLFKEPLPVNDANRAQVTEDYKYVYEHLLAKVENTLGVRGDHCTKDLARVCFVSDDPILFKRNVYVDIDEILAEARRKADVAKATGLVLNPPATPSCEGLRPSTPVINNGISPHNPEEEFERAREVVRKLAAIRFDYKDFVKAGMALYSGFGERGKEIWMLLMDNPNYSDTVRSMETHWNSFRSVKNVTLASLYYVGGKYGCN
jgi:hypothetical protein